MITHGEGSIEYERRNIGSCLSNRESFATRLEASRLFCSDVGTLVRIAFGLVFFPLCFVGLLLHSTCSLG